MSEISPPCVILNEPQLAENIGSVARVMANFGLSELRLVRPRDGWPQERAWVSASGANWPLDNAKVYQRLEAAAADRQLVCATAARNRELRLPVMTQREGAAKLNEAAGASLKTAFLFGGERAGLETQDVALCQGVVTIPIDPKFHSLNLAQAVALCAYEWRTALGDVAPPRFKHMVSPLADHTMLDGLFGHLESELEAGGFFHPPEKKPSMVDNLRAIFARAGLNEQEVRTLRGVITALSEGRGRVLEKLAKKRAEAK